MGCIGRDKVGSLTCRVSGGGGRSKVNTIGNSGPVTAIGGEPGDDGLLTQVLGIDGNVDGTSPGVGDGASLGGGEHSMLGVLYPPRRRLVVRGGPGPHATGDCVVLRARCGKRGVPGDGSGDDGAGYILVTDGASRAIVGC